MIDIKSKTSQKFQKIFEQIDKLLRPTSVAQIGKARPNGNVLTSRFGGHFVGLSGEEWPLFRGRNMLPLIQVRLDELPLVPDELANIALFSVFVDPELPPVEAVNGNGWLIRTYSSLTSLEPIATPAAINPLKAFQILWVLEEKDSPSWEDVWEIIKALDTNETEPLLELFQVRYKTSHKTKIGGWPSFIQSGIASDEPFIFQINSEPKVNWIWGDNGSGYFFRDSSQTWKLYWQCY
jgi:uncharacterized protein YwqG